jgi:hypothetical protein
VINLSDPDSRVMHSLSPTDREVGEAVLVSEMIIAPAILRHACGWYILCAQGGRA